LCVCDIVCELMNRQNFIKVNFYAPEVQKKWYLV
jgi:hypothetical protein